MASKQEIREYYKRLKDALAQVQYSQSLSQRQREELTDMLLERLSIIQKWYFDDFTEDEIKELENYLSNN